MFDVVGFGALNIDRLIHVEELSSLDTEVHALDETSEAGGSAANTIFGVAQLGASASYIGAVGGDSAGTRLRASLSRVGVDTRYVITKEGERSGEAICVTDFSGRRLIIVQPAANSSYNKHDLESAAEGLRDSPPKIVHFSSLVAIEQLELQAYLAQELRGRCKLSSSPGALYVRRGRGQVTGLLQQCDYLFFNRREVTDFVGLPYLEYEQAAGSILNEFEQCKAVIVTLGSGGERPRLRRGQLYLNSLLEDDQYHSDPLSAAVVTRDEVISIPRRHPAGAVIDATGAGDAYAAGFLYGLAQGMSLHWCALAGYIAAQHVILQPGARAGALTREALESALRDLEGASAG